MAARKTNPVGSGSKAPSSGSKLASAAGLHYKVLARRWRPQQFDDLVGQEAIAQALRGAITAERVAHAYLFTGARGVGKTSTARILAKALNCSTGPTSTPCGTCDACEGIVSGDDVDVLEIDGASNRGIDEVRELRQNANLRPTRSRYKIYIIDEVHMLTREAFNALLKTLEEPPQHVKFIFATTDPQKIPVTILSRCQRFDFGTISQERIQQRLETIVQSEGIAVEDEVLELITRRAGGSMRDALSLLDQLLAFGGERIARDQVYRLLGTASEDRMLELVDSLTARNAGRAIQLLDDAESAGVQLGELIDQLIEYFRDLLVAKSAGPEARLVSVSSRQRGRVVEQAAGLSLEFILAGTDILAETKNRLRGSNYGRVLVDVALVRIASLEDLGPLGDLVERLAAIETQLGTGRLSADAAAGSPTPRTASGRELKKNYPATEPIQPALTPPPTLSHGPPVAVGSSAGLLPLENDGGPDQPAAYPSHSIPSPLTPEAAARLLHDLSQDFSPMLKESIARAKVVVGSAPDTLVVHLDAMYNKAGRVKEIEDALQQRVGTSLRIRVELGSPAAQVVPEPPKGRSSYSERLSEANRDPLVQQAMEVFGARVIRVDES